MADRVHLFSGRATGYPDPYGRVGRAVLEHVRKHTRPEHLENLGIAKEPGHRDEDVVEEGLDFFRVRADEVDIPGEGLRAFQRHATLDSPAECGLSVIREVDSRAGAQQLEELPRRGRVLELSRPGLLEGRLLAHVGVVRDPGDLLRDAVRRQDEVGGAGQDGRARHFRERRGSRHPARR